MKKFVLICSMISCLSFSAAAESSITIMTGSLVADMDLLSLSEQTTIGLDPFVLLEYGYEQEDFSCTISAQLQFVHAYVLKSSYMSRFAFDPLLLTGSLDRFGVISLEDLGISPFTSEFLWNTQTGYIGLRPMLYADSSDVIVDISAGWGMRDQVSLLVQEDTRVPVCIEGYDLFIGLNPDVNFTYDLSYTNLMLGVSASAGYGRRISDAMWMRSSLNAELPLLRDLLGDVELSPDLILSADAQVYQLLSEELYLQGITDLVVHNIFDALVLEYTAAAQLHYLLGRGDLFVSAGVTGLLDGIESLDVKLGGTWLLL